MECWHDLMEKLRSEKQEEPSLESKKVVLRPPFARIANLFLDYCQKNCDIETYRVRRSFLRRFTRARVEDSDGRQVTVGKVEVHRLKKFMLTRWVEQNSQWSNSTKRMAINVVITCLNWAVSERYIRGWHPGGRS
jgi:hypothetical protein